MNEKLQKYFDGELSEPEATAFLEALAHDPELESEFDEFERALVAITDVARGGPSPGFSDGVMQRISTRRRRVGSRVGRWTMRLAWAGACALAFAIGRFDSPPRVETPQVPPPVVTMEAPLRVARLVYVPQNAGVERVSVAGTFNAWNPDMTAMEKVGEVWVIYVMLPPATYEYMFVEDGQRWVTDPLAAQTRDDGFGKRNAVLDLTL